MTRRTIGNQTRQRTRHRHARAGAVFGNCAAWNVNVRVVFFRPVAGNAQQFGVRACIRHRGFGGFFHHVAQVAREFGIAFSVHERNFNRHYFAAEFGVGQTLRDTDFIFFLRHAERIFARA